MKSFASVVTGKLFGKYISSPTTFTKSSSVLISKGTLPYSNSYVNIPLLKNKYQCSKHQFCYHIADFEQLQVKNKEESRIEFPLRGENEQTTQNHTLSRFPKLIQLYFMNQNILRFYISMDNVAVMHKLNCMANLPGNSFHFLLRKTSLVLQIIVHISSTTKFQNQIKIVFI